MTFLNEHLTRQLDIVPIDILGTKLTVIGAGAIGGWTTLALAKMGFEDITVFDFDKVDTVNLNAQFYRRSDVGKTKVVALRDLVEDFTGTKIKIVEGKYTDGVFPGVVISAVDNMAVRRLIWENHKGMAPMTKAIIDPRMGAEDAYMIVVNPMSEKDGKDYEKTLYSDTEAVQERCTAKATIYTANLLSGLVVKGVKSLLTRKDYLRVAQWNIGEDEFLGIKYGQKFVCPAC